MFAILLIILLLLYNIDACEYPNCFNANNECLPATSVQLCKECNFRGQIIDSDNICQCISNDMDPQLDCLRISEEFRFRNTSYTRNKATCSCYEDFENGCFKLSTPNDLISLNPFNISILTHLYGDPDPPVCNECCSNLYGPPPKTITASLETFGIFACNQYGAGDPNEIFTPNQNEYEVPKVRNLLAEDVTATDWRECAAHGTFNTEKYGCECDTEWQLGPNEYRNFTDNLVYLCETCKPLYGPPPPWETPREVEYYQPPFCEGPFTPDRIDGEYKICSGHGQLENGECVCDQNSTSGFWELSPYSEIREVLELTEYGTYITVEQNITVLTCFSCIEGFVDTNLGPCTFNGTAEPTLPTDIPTASPTKNPTTSPTKNPTKNPTKFPTNSPTKNPTKSPSFSPTISYEALIFYELGEFQGNVGNFSTVKALCETAQPVGPNCEFSIPFLVYDIPFSDFPSEYGFPPNTPMYGPFGDLIAPNYANAIVPGSLDQSLQDANVIASNPLWWNGFSFFGNCEGWTTNSNSFTGNIGLTTTTTTSWLLPFLILDRDCDQTYSVVCMCVADQIPPTFSPTESPTKNPTRSPTKNPTKNPTHSPTTSAPTKNPTKNPTHSPTTSAPTKNPTKNPTHSPTTSAPTKNPTKNPTNSPTKNPTKNPTKSPTQNPTIAPVIPYTAFVLTEFRPGIFESSIRNKAVDDAACPGYFAAQNPLLNCDVAESFLDYGTPFSDFPEVYKFDPDLPIYSPYQGIVSTSYIDAVDNNLLSVNFLNAYPSIFPTASPIPGQQYFTGSPTANCDLWTSNAPTTQTEIGQVDSVSGWLDRGSTSGCQFTRRFLCFCLTKNPLPITLAPTTSPTKIPTKNPTKSPTKNPTKSPTNSPTKNPTQTPTIERFLVLYPALSWGGDYAASFGGDRANYIQECYKNVPDTIAGFSTIFEWTYYSTDTFADKPNNYLFSINAEIYGPDGVLISNDYEASVINGGSAGSISNSLITANVDGPNPYFLDEVYFSGYGGNNCGDWSDFTSGTYYTGVTTSTSATWVNNVGFPCTTLVGVNKGLPFLCAAVVTEPLITGTDVLVGYPMFPDATGNDDIDLGYRAMADACRDNKPADLVFSRYLPMATFKNSQVEMDYKLTDVGIALNVGNTPEFKGPTGTTCAPTFQNAISFTLSVTLETCGVLQTSSPTIATTFFTGEDDINCDDWTSSGGNVDYGSRTTLAAGTWYNTGATVSCASANGNFACIGVVKDGATKAPTTSPTMSPTPEPMVSFTYLKMWGADFYASSAVGGSRTACNTNICSSGADLPADCDVNIGCLSSFADLDLIDFPAFYGFNENLPLFHQNDVIASNSFRDAVGTSSSNTGNLINAVRFNTISQAVSMNSNANRVGTYDSTSSCDGWTSDSGSFTYGRGRTQNTNADWLQGGGIACNAPSRFLCLCGNSGALPGTLAPTS